jgi:hypothetical protein
MGLKYKRGQIFTTLPAFLIILPHPGKEHQKCDRDQRCDRDRLFVDSD